MEVTKLIINPYELLGPMRLTDIAPFPKYENGIPTDIIEGFNYNVSLAKHRYDKIAVKIKGEQKIDTPTESMEVNFKDLEIYFYKDKSNQIHIGARATDISVVNAK